MSILSYLKETKGELAHVNWPSRKQSVVFSIIVIIVSIVVSIFLGVLDFIFSKIINLVI
ncbi:MAG: preprotein translocase subunit SecE [Patescibacteria group bacterium]